MDDYHPTSLLLVVLLALGVLYVFFSATALAINRSRGKRLRELLKDEAAGDPKLGRFIVAQAKTYILTAQLGMYLSALLMGALSVDLADHATGNFGAQALKFLGPLEFLLWLSAFVVASLIWTLGINQVVKPLILKFPERHLSRCGVVIVFFSKLFAPFLFILDGAIGRLIARLGVDVPAERDLAVSAEELSEIVEISTEAGEFEREEKEMIQGVVHFSGTLVREVMTPRKDIVAVDESATLDEILRIFQNEKLSRILVTGRDLDDVRGILLAKDFIQLVNQPAGKFELKRFMRRAYYVSNTKKVDRLLEEFRRDAVHFAVVLDEYGGVDGVVTLEDLIEEIVGEIFDEHDSPLEEASIVRTTSGDLLVDGSMLIGDLNIHQQFDFPEGDYDTLAGFFIQSLGRIPVLGEELEYKHIRLRIEEMSHNRITQVRIINPKKANESKGLNEHSFEPSRPAAESNHKGAQSPKRLNASGER